MTWEKSWTVLSNANRSTTESNNSSPVPKPSAAGSETGLSRGAKIGAGLGTTIGVLGLGSAVVLVGFFKRKNGVLQEDHSEPRVQKDGVHEKDTQPHLEIGHGLRHEAGTENEIQEI